MCTYVRDHHLTPSPAILSSLAQIILCFKEAFWRESNKSADIFGVCHPANSKTPGACYAFWDLSAATGHATVVAISAGRGAEEQEMMDDAQATNLATATLCRVFKKEVQPEYAVSGEEFVWIRRRGGRGSREMDLNGFFHTQYVTRWRADPHIR